MNQPVNQSTVVDIARIAQVSPATVSRVINHPDRVKPERVMAVRKAMLALDYIPAPLHNRRGPKSSRLEARNIGVWFIGASSTSITHWFQDQVSRQKTGMAQRRVSISAFSTESPDRVPAQLEKRGVDGIILLGMEPSPAAWRRLSTIPNVWLMTRRSGDYPGDFVEPDNAANGRIAAEYLASRGHRLVTVLSTDPHYSAIDQRIQSFMSSCLDLGLQAEIIVPDSRNRPAYLEEYPSWETVHPLVEQWVAGTPRTTGIYLPADTCCETFLKASAQLGLKPNRHFEVILGNYSPAIYSRLSHQPTTIDINLSTLVNRAIEHLLWRIDHPDLAGRIGIQISPSIKASPLVRVLNGHARNEVPEALSAAGIRPGEA